MTTLSTKDDQRNRLSGLSPDGNSSQTTEEVFVVSDSKRHAGKYHRLRNAVKTFCGHDAVRMEPKPLNEVNDEYQPCQSCFRPEVGA